MVEVYRVVPAAGSLPSLEPVVDVAAPSLPPGHSRAAVDRLAAQSLAGSTEARAVETLGAAGDLLHAAAVIRTKEGKPSGVVVATAYLTGDLAARSRRMTKAFEDYNQLRVLKRPLTGLYLSFFLMVTLLILFGATWMGSYLAKRITRPVLMLSAAAREIGAGRLDQRVEPQSNDEFGSLVEAFNSMARELAAGRRKVDRGTIQLERKHGEVEGRRRYIETILERIATGVVSVDAVGRDHHDQHRRGAAAQPRPADRRAAGAGGVRSRRFAAARRAAGRGRAAGPRRAADPRDCAGARGTGAAPRRGGDRAGRRERRARKASCWCSTM